MTRNVSYSLILTRVDKLTGISDLLGGGLLLLGLAGGGDAVRVSVMNQTVVRERL